MKDLSKYINEKQNIGEISSVFKDRMAGASGVLCPIHKYIERLEKNVPIVCGNWNPNEYVDKFHFNKFIEWVKEEWPAALQDNHEDELWCMEGTTYENPESQKNAVDIYKALDLIVEKLGEPTGGGGVKNPCFGKLGLGSKYTYDYYFGQGKGGVLLKGAKLPCNQDKEEDIKGERIINWAIFLDSDTFNELGFQVEDHSDPIGKYNKKQLSGKQII